MNVVHPNQSCNQSSNTSTKAGERAAPSRVAYTPEFEGAWAAYPKRAGGNPKKPAFRCYTQRLREGASHDDLLAATEHYRAHCDRERETGGRFVMMAKTFFGSNERWRDFLEPVSANSTHATGNLQEITW